MTVEFKEVDVTSELPPRWQGILQLVFSVLSIPLFLVGVLRGEWLYSLAFVSWILFVPLILFFDLQRGTFRKRQAITDRARIEDNALVIDRYADESKINFTRTYDLTKLWRVVDYPERIHLKAKGLFENTSTIDKRLFATDNDVDALIELCKLNGAQTERIRPEGHSNTLNVP